MKTTSRALFIAAGMIIPGLCFGQFVFSTSINTTNGPVQATGSLDFDLDNGAIEFTVTNVTSFTSHIVGAWFLNPIVDGSPASPDFTEVEHNNSGSAVSDATSSWDDSSSVDNGTWQFVRTDAGASQSDKDKYVGVEFPQGTSTNETIESPSTPAETSTFSFDVPELAGKSELYLLDYLGQQAQNAPAIVFRWKNVDPQFVQGGSAKGYAYIDLTITPIPEPSQIAGLSVLGISGLLFVRRRYIARKRMRAAA